MTKRRQHGRYGMVAVAVAILMAFQSLLGPFAMAAGAASPMLDAFGNPLCIAGMEGHEPASAPGKDHALMPECCTLACSMSFAFVPTDRAVAILFTPLVQPLPRVRVRYADQIRSVLDDLPGNPRAPPVAA